MTEQYYGRQNGRPHHQPSSSDLKINVAAERFHIGARAVLLRNDLLGNPFVAVWTGVYNTSAFENGDCLMVLENLGSGPDRTLEVLQKVA